MDAYSNLMIRMGSVLCGAIDRVIESAANGEFDIKQIEKMSSTALGVVDSLEQMNVALELAKARELAKLKGATR